MVAAITRIHSEGKRLPQGHQACWQGVFMAFPSPPSLPPPSLVVTLWGGWGDAAQASRGWAQGSPPAKPRKHQTC